ncbi:ATP/GTP-binding protein [Myxococcota bacterium]
MQLDFAARELTIKLVYYGPALSGKTTNLQALHAVASTNSCGRLMTLDTRDDRTLFFDLLPMAYREPGGLSVRLKIFTVPGQVIHASTRRLVVQAADGIVFVADSRLNEEQNNAESLVDLRQNLTNNGLSLGQLPLVIQFNKRDLPNVRSDQEIAELAANGQELVYLSVATQGVGVVETFMGLLFVTWNALDEKHGLVRKFGIEPQRLLDQVARSLGACLGAGPLLEACVGGSLSYLKVAQR